MYMGRKPSLLPDISQEPFQELCKNLLNVCESVGDHVTYEKQPVTLELIKSARFHFQRTRKW